MKKAAMLLFTVLSVFLPAALVTAAPAQKYTLSAENSKVTAYVSAEDIYVRPQDIASAYSGTDLAFDVTLVDGVYAVTLDKDFTGTASKFKSKGSYDNAPETDISFSVAGYDATGHIKGIDIEGEKLMRLKDLSRIAGFTYTRSKTTGELNIYKNPSSPIEFGSGLSLSADDYITGVTKLFYGAVMSNSNMRVITKSADIARLLTPDNYKVEGVKVSTSLPLVNFLSSRRSATLKESATRDIDPDKPMVAITFDDGPRPGNTERILEALDAVDGRATFFMVGTCVANYPDTVKAVAEQGSEIGCHTYDHPQLTKLGTSGAMENINKANKLIENATGVAPVIGRPPYGSIDADIINASGMEWFNWSLDTLDWKYRNADTVYNTVISNVGDRDVILMHDIHATTVDAAVRIIPKLDEMGYQLVTISELAEVMDGAENVSGHIKR